MKYFNEDKLIQFLKDEAGKIEREIDFSGFEEYVEQSGMCFNRVTPIFDMIIYLLMNTRDKMMETRYEVEKLEKQVALLEGERHEQSGK